MKKRIISILLAAVMVVAMVPATLIAVFAEEPSNPVINFVGNATLDGQNTDGEYDTATKVMLNAYGNDTNGDNMRIVYTEEAVYVLVEVFDDTLVRYADGGSSKCDFVFLGFSLGTSFQGMKRVYRDTTGTGRDVFTVPGAYVNMSDGNAELETKYFGYTEDENGFRLEARFPVDEMSERDRALYELGQLEIRFTAGTQDGVNNEGTITSTYDGDVENRDWDGKATEDYFESGSYKAKNPSNYPEYAFEFVSDEEYVEPEEPEAPKADYMAYVSNPTFDGQNTNGEYDNAYSFPFVPGPWGAAATGNESLKVVYSDDAIYVLLESIDNTDGSADNGDFFALSFAIGTSYVSTQIEYRQNAPQYTNQGGTVSMSSTWSLSATYFKKTVTADKISFEAKFPVASMSAEDQAAFADRTLSVKIGAAISDNWVITETFSGIYNNRAKTTSIISGATALTFAEKFEYADSTAKGIHYVKHPTLDGVNSNGEYDNSYVNNFQAALWSNVSHGTETMKVMYSDDAIYVLFESIDDVANSDDFIYLNYNVGTSFVGNLQSNRNNANVTSAMNKISGNDVSTSWLKRVDTAEGWSFEAMFPVSSMTAEDQTAFAEGTLGVAFSIAYLDHWGGGQNLASQTHSTAYNKGTPAHELVIMPKGMVEDKTIIEAEMTFISDAKYDGLNTNGEYNKADAIVIGNKVSGSVKLPSGNSGSSIGDVPSGSYYKVIYADDGIYVFVNIADTTPAYYGKQGEGIQEAYGFADQVAITYSIGSSFVGKDYAYRHGTMGATNTGAGTLTGYPSTQKDNNAAGWTYEIKFPYSGMTEDDKAAFTAGTLVAEFNVTIADRMTNTAWGWYDGVIYTSNNGYEFTPAAKGTNYAESVVLDGKNTDHEYNTATNILSNVGLWGSTPTGNEAIAKVVYTNEAIYILVEVTDDTTDAPGDDFLYLQLAVGESFRGTKVTNKETTETDEGYTNVGGAVNLTSYQTTLFKETHTDTTLTLEVRLPVSLMTEADREALAAGTLSVAIATCYSNNWVIAQSHESGYGTATDTKLEAIPAIELAARPAVENEFKGASLSLGEDINVNYYATLVAKDVAMAMVKFTYNGKTFIVKPTATDNVDQYVFVFEHLAPQCMGDEIDAKLLIGAKVVDEANDYSALKNCENLLANEATSATAKQLIYDLLAYGAAAQVFANYKTDALVNAGYEEFATNVESIENSDRVVGDSLTDGRFTAANVYFGNTNKVCVKFVADDIENVTITINGVAVEFEKCNELGEYIAYSEDIKVADFDKVYTFVLTTASGTQQLTYSVNAYAAAKYNSANAATAALAQALYAYGVSAEAYVA